MVTSVDLFDIFNQLDREKRLFCKEKNKIKKYMLVYRYIL